LRLTLAAFHELVGLPPAPAASKIAAGLLLSVAGFHRVFGATHEHR
jgi:hypothetical protein